MAVKLVIPVADIAATLASGYTHIKIYRSAQSTSGFAEITTSSSMVPLEVGVSSYEYIDFTATPNHYYKVTYYDGSVESVFGSVFQGTFFDTSFSDITYPLETYITSSDYFVVDYIRTLIGDHKELTRDYVSVTEGFDSISLDGKTHALSNPLGWPVNVTWNGSPVTTVSGARVVGYQFVTVSGVLDTSSDSTDVLDIWYHHFRFSDSQILVAYNNRQPPPSLTADQVTQELKMLCTAIDLLASELRLSGITSGVEVDIYQEIRMNPKAGMDARFKDLEALMKRKDKLIAEIEASVLSDNLRGVLID